ncbi:hypothetical protein OPKNFCMD_3939 [Methylobacterium crusticola]|uniref:Uncharacterized protein n=1 Tax=Methylobacterium crusticola TaxID=1697972 RepID=A0ABQ4R357_9HYPH|nr:hypothetical protein [Methylobacterium crusticola]GJD51187.1 hypothetical protein OPKNFCMD_3939 [Methylobacterium crusticola]
MFETLLKSIGGDRMDNETHFYKFVPKPDITAYELALILRRFGSLSGGTPPMHGVVLMPWETLEPDYERHFALAPHGMFQGG